MADLVGLSSLENIRNFRVTPVTPTTGQRRLTLSAFKVEFDIFVSLDLDKFVDAREFTVKYRKGASVCATSGFRWSSHCHLVSFRFLCAKRSSRLLKMGRWHRSCRRLADAN